MVTVRNFASIISADSHVYEPSDLWWKALGDKFGERTPRTIVNYQGRGERTFTAVIRVYQ